MVSRESSIDLRLERESLQTSDLLQRTKERDSKYRFLSIMSHELKTPLAGIVGISSMLGSAGPLNEKQELYVKKLLDCSLQLMNRINNILDFTKMAAGSLVLQREPMDIRDAIEDSIKMIDCKIEEKGLQLDVQMKDIPLVLGDRHRLTQIISNILSNSIKFTDIGKILVSVYSETVQISDVVLDTIYRDATKDAYRENIKDAYRETGNKENKKENKKEKIKIVLTISDTGIGIPVSERSLVFKDFVQSSNLSSYQSNLGTGLGLSISKELCKMMNGDIRVIDPIFGTGTSIEMILYLDKDISHLTDISSISGANVLVVDDRLEMRLLISDILFRWNCAHNTVSSAEEALHFLKKGNRYDIVIVDICMEHMNGIELAQIIRKKYPNLPLIGISSLDITNGDLFFDYYMFKPIDHRELFSAIKGCMNMRRNDDISDSSYEDIPRLSPDYTPTYKTYKDVQGIDIRHDNSNNIKREIKKLSILIAEDDNTNSFTLKEMLVMCGIANTDIDIVVDGKQCYDRVLTKRYDIVFMDIIMPIYDGIETTKRINRLENPPIIIATSASSHRSDRDRCSTAGFSGYMSKPIMIEDIVSILRPFL